MICCPDRPSSAPRSRYFSPHLRAQPRQRRRNGRARSRAIQMTSTQIPRRSVRAHAVVQGRRPRLQLADRLLLVRSERYSRTQHPMRDDHQSNQSDPCALRQTSTAPPPLSPMLYSMIPARRSAGADRQHGIHDAARPGSSIDCQARAQTRTGTTGDRTLAPPSSRGEPSGGSASAEEMRRSRLFQAPAHASSPIAWKVLLLFRERRR